MKKLVSIISSLLLLFGVCGCSSGTNADLSGTTQIFNTMTDYSGVQGYKNWYYLVAEDELSNAQYMIYDADMCTWRTSDTNCLIEYHIVHPGQLQQVIRAWKAPADGNAVFTSQLQRRPVSITGGGADGCYAFVAIGDNDEDVLFEQAYSARDIEIHDIDGEAQLKKGEMIYFVLNCSGNYTFDQTYWNITVNFTFD